MKNMRDREIHLRSDMGKDQGITTIIETGPDEENQVGMSDANGAKRADSRNALGGNAGWRMSEESKRSLGSASEDGTGVNWKGGITKTTVSRQVVG